MSVIKVGRHPLLEKAYEVMIRQQSDVDHRMAKDVLIALDELLSLPGAPLELPSLKRAEAEATQTMPAQIGEFIINPLESAIRDTVSMLRDEREALAGQQGIKTVVCLRLEKHLEGLLAIQLSAVSQ